LDEKIGSVYGETDPILLIFFRFSLRPYLE
jgi:hypothetical protein